MARVSLKEAYDNKDVVAQIYAIRDIAEGASDTADSAKTTADDAKTYVDTLGVQVEGAVQTANDASASAQTSAETVSQYDTRLTSAEEDIEALDNDLGEVETGLNAVTLRVTTAEGNIVTIQGRVTALETADGQNVKINNINAYAVGLTGNQSPISGTKSFTGNLTHKNLVCPGSTSPASYVSARGSIRIVGSDDAMIAGMGFEKSTSDVTRIVFSVNSNLDTFTNRTPVGELHLIVDEISGNIRLQPAHVDKDGTRVFGTAQTLMSWTV